MSKDSINQSLKSAHDAFKQAQELVKVAKKLKETADEALLNAEIALEEFQKLSKEYLTQYKKLKAENPPEEPVFIKKNDDIN